MSSMIVRPPDDEHAYEQIESAVMETARGRWFLAEYARRNRHAETLTILEAIESLHRNVVHRSPALPGAALHDEIIEMARAISRAEREIRALRPDGAAARQLFSASDELDAVVETTEKATSSILAAAERVQEYAWTLRENNGSDADCDLLDACATEIYTACGFQDLTAQRTRKVIDALRFLDHRLKSILAAAGLAEDFEADEMMIAENDIPEAPKSASADIWMGEAHQAEIDETFDFFTPAAVSEPTMVGAELMDFDPVSPPSDLSSSTAPQPKDTPGKDEEPAPSANATQELSSMSYDALGTEDKLRAFR